MSVVFPQEDPPPFGATPHSREEGRALLQRLKDETRALHRRLEQNPRLRRLLQEDLTRTEYRALLARLYGFYVPVERALGRRPEWAALGFSFEERKKVPLLRADLAALGLAGEGAAALPRCAALPDLSGFGRSLGGLYVLEGATLGGKIIARYLRRTLGLDAACGAAFYAAYGDRTGPMWKAFRRVLVTSAAAPGVGQEQVLAGAAETFSKLDLWLS